MSWIKTVRGRVASWVRGKQDAAEDNRDLRTLAHWRDMLSGYPRTIECSQMSLFGRDDEGEIFKGPGRIEIRSETEIRFFMYGTADDPTAASRKYLKAQTSPYDTLEQFRIYATDYRGIEWAGGYTALEFFTDHQHGWPLGGEIQSLSTHATGFSVSKRSSVELLLIPPIDLPTTQSLKTEAHIGGRRIMSSAGPGQHTIDILGTTVTFSYEPSGKALWITADTSAAFNHPFAENWLTEPLRILLGVPIYPRLVARNLGDGTAQVWLRPSPRQKAPSAVGLLPPFSINGDRRAIFWQLYADTLTMIASAKGFEAHPITQYYDELTQAQLGSRWLLTMTMASTAEALADDLMEPEDRRAEYSEEALDAMKKHLKAFAEDEALKMRMLSNLGMVSKRSVLAFMRDIAKEGTLDPAHVRTWHDIRNSVMHGNLVDPWSTEEGDAHLKEMLQLVHDLTRAIIAKG